MQEMHTFLLVSAKKLIFTKETTNEVFIYGNECLENSFELEFCK